LRSSPVPARPVFSGDGGAATKAQLNAPAGLVVNGDGELLVADHHNNRIRVIDQSGVISTLRGSYRAGLSDPIASPSPTTVPCTSRTS
jgi:hypothetical protein